MSTNYSIENRTFTEKGQKLENVAVCKIDKVSSTEQLTAIADYCEHNNRDSAFLNRVLNTGLNVVTADLARQTVRTSSGGAKAVLQKTVNVLTHRQAWLDVQVELLQAGTIDAVGFAEVVAEIKAGVYDDEPLTPIETEDEVVTDEIAE